MHVWQYNDGSHTLIENAVWFTNMTFDDNSSDGYDSSNSDSDSSSSLLPSTFSIAEDLSSSDEHGLLVHGMYGISCLRSLAICHTYKAV